MSQDATLKNKIHNLVDFSIGLESFAEMEMDKPNPYKDYHGVVHLHKISAVNTLNAFTPKITDLGFKLRRKKFVIEKLHLPPGKRIEIKLISDPIILNNITITFIINIL